MKILSIRQPWAYLIVAGYKPVENRTWNTSYRGPLLIHASQAMEENDFPVQREWIKTLNQYLIAGDESPIVIPEDLPRGAIVGAATLTDVWDKKKFERPGIRWFEGPYGFKMEDAVEFAEPIPWRGQLGIRDADLDIGDYVDVFEMVIRPPGLRRSEPQGWAA
jgi:hypothetical protein